MHAYNIVSFYITASVSGQVCTAPDTVGSLDHDGIIITADQTFILAGYTVQCEGIVTTWEFCYQILGAESVTFYPGIWEITETNSGRTTYSLIQANTVTFDPRGTESFSCQSYTLSLTEQFTAPSRSVVGLYSNLNVQLLQTNINRQITTYQMNGNQSRATVRNNRDDIDYNIAIRVHLGKNNMSLMQTILHININYKIYSIIDNLRMQQNVLTQN